MIFVRYFIYFPLKIVFRKSEQVINYHFERDVDMVSAKTFFLIIDLGYFIFQPGSSLRLFVTQKQMHPPKFFLYIYKYSINECKL